MRYRLAATATLVLGVYLQCVEWIDLFPWNDVRQGNGQETLNLAIAAATLVMVPTIWRGSRSVAAIATLGLTLWAWLQVQTWWMPYWFGATPAWARVYERWFSETITWIPRSADRLAPDANHLVLQALILIAWIACLIAAMRANGGPTSGSASAVSRSRSAAPTAPAP
jgi:hypothetical protein